MTVANKTSEAPRIVFMGSPDFAAQSLRLLAEEYNIIAVYSQPPRPKGRGMHLAPQPVHQVADEYGIPVRTPDRFDQSAIDDLASLSPDLLIVVAYGLILPEAVLAIPRLGAINGHASLLPRWRGAAPIHFAIAAGDRETGVSIMMMEKGLDTGAVILERRIEIAADDTTGILHDKLADLTATALAEAIPMLINGSATFTPQDHTSASYAHKITDTMTALDFNDTTARILNKIRAFSPWPAAWITIMHDGKTRRINVLAANATKGNDTSDKAAGTILGKGTEGGIVIATIDSAIELTKLKPAGKAMMSGRDYLNGNPMPDHIIPPIDKE